MCRTGWELSMSRLAGLLAGVVVVAAGTLHAAPLKVAPNSTSLLLDGRPWRGVGVNYFDAFGRTLYNSKNTTYRNGFRVLDSLKIPFVRLAFCGINLQEMNYYNSDKALYFRLMDSVVATARRYKIGLIPTLIWQVKVATDMTGQPYESLADTSSLTNRWMAQYVEEVVSRYRNEPTIWGWELFNELYPFGDLPKTSPNYRPLTTADVQDIHRMLANRIRKHDPDRLISSGNQLPSSDQYHRFLYRTDTVKYATGRKPDSRAEHRAALDSLHPQPINLLSSHIYYFSGETGRFFSDMKVTEAGYIQEFPKLGKELGMPVFLGEFGVNDKALDASGVPLDSAGQAAMFFSMLGAIERSWIPLSALWVYDYEYFNPPGMASVGVNSYWTVRMDNNRRYQLVAISEANARMRTVIRPPVVYKELIQSLTPTEKQVVFSIVAEPSSQVAAFVYDLQGRLVRKIEYDRSSARLVWDLRGLGGNRVRKGIYQLQLTVDGSVDTRSFTIF